MEKVKLQKKGNMLLIGELPQLIVNLENQENYIKMDDRIIPYRREVLFSEDLLRGKRPKVWETAVNYYYNQACKVAEGMAIAEAYRGKANTTVREKR